MSIPDLNNASTDLLALFELTPDLVCIAGRNGYFKNFNAAVIHTLGYTREELLASPIFTFVHPDDLEATRKTREAMINGTTLVNFQNRYFTKQGAIIWLEWTSIYISDRDVVFAIAKNITTRKQREQELHDQFLTFRQLASNFKTGIERDRKNVAAQLHEELAQLATVIKLDVDWISSNIAAPSGTVKSRMDHTMVTTDHLVETIRRISFSISPAILEDLGLEAALDWYCSDFAAKSGLVCIFNSNFNEGVINKEVSLDFFRICQESLTAIRKSSNASQVIIDICEEGQFIILSITDNSSGSEHYQRPTVPGLLDMHERAALINARCIIDHQPGKSNTIRVELKCEV